MRELQYTDYTPPISSPGTKDEDKLKQAWLFTTYNNCDLPGLTIGN